MRWGLILVRCLTIMLAAPVVVHAGESGAEGQNAVSKPWVQFVSVEPGVKLEVLDWGGPGNGGAARPLVLLSGLGDTAHAYDRVCAAVHFALSRLRDHAARLWRLQQA
jgi:hypothetical protein